MNHFFALLKVSHNFSQLEITSQLVAYKNEWMSVNYAVIYFFLQYIKFCANVIKRCISMHTYYPFNQVSSQRCTYVCVCVCVRREIKICEKSAVHICGWLSQFGLQITSFTMVLFLHWINCVWGCYWK